MANAKYDSIGQNVEFAEDGSYFYFRVDKSESCGQTKNSKGFNEDGTAKKPQEMVGSTRAFVVLGTDTGERAMIHVIRPLAVKAVRKARALRELDEDASEAGETQVDVAQLKALAKREGVSLSELVEMLKG